MSTAAEVRTPAPPIPSAVLGMALFLVTEIMFFAGLISAFLVLRAGHAGEWPPPGQPRLPVGITAANTAVLLLSGWAMYAALKAARRNAEPHAVARRLSLAAALGALFLVVQGGEWVRLLGFGLTARSSLYGGTFYTLIGAHGLHVLSALVAVVFVVLRARRGRYRAADHAGLRSCFLYWTFVVAVWPVLYVLVYLS